MNAHIPIVGQAFTPTGGTITVIGWCGCGASQTGMKLTDGVAAACPACGRLFVLGTVGYNRRTGNLAITIDAVTREAPHATTTD